MRRSKKSNITDVLIEKKIITQAELAKALALQRTTDKKIEQILIDEHFVEEKILIQMLSEQLNIPFIDLNAYAIHAATVRLLPEFYARNYRAIVLKKEPTDYLVGMVDPQNLFAQEEIERILASKIKVALIKEDEFLYAVDNIYRRTGDISQFAETLSAELKPEEVNIFSQMQDFNAEDVPVVNLLRSIFEDAVQVNASDIHIEPGEHVLRIRLRVDGVLQEQIIEEKAIAQAIVQRIKLIAGLNIAEKRLPQDGRFSITVKKQKFDVRVSTIPVQYGESLVMRLLNQTADLLNLDHIGMPAPVLKYYRQLLYASYGLFLIVGPTGGGKTTTLYASLNELNKAEDKIITVEDPIEYRLPRINQVQVNAKINLTFASVLRSILRQDPDIIMVGELRDQETVEIALRAAMTGHFVLATLHTNDTISSAARLVDMGAPGYLVASVLRGIMAQRLVRRNCQMCIKNDPLTDSEKAWLASAAPDQYKEVVFKRGRGCTYCHETGYQGRIGVFELLGITGGLTDALRCTDLGLFETLAAKQPLYHSLLLTGLDLAAQGVTSVEEIIHMAGEI